MSKLKFRNAFIFQDKKSIKLVKNHLMKTLKISTMNSVYGSGEDLRDSIAVLEKDYEKAIIEGRKFAFLERLKDVKWINYYDEPMNLAEMGIACATFPSYDVSKCREVFEYLRNMGKAIGVKDIWNRKFDDIEDAFLIYILGFDNEAQIEKLKLFVEKEGTGPYTTICPLSKTGEISKKPFVKVKK